MYRLSRFVVAPLAALVLFAGSVTTTAGANGAFAPGIAAAATPAAAFVMPPFYDVPSPLPDGLPGTIIKSEVVADAGLHGTLLRVMYKSTSIKGVDIPVTGMIAVPDTPPPAGGYPVVSWAHGTTGIADQCAPSLSPGDSTDLFNPLLDQGYLVVATDYEGLGTPGRHPYIVGDSEAHGVLDIVRAARNIPDVTHASDNYLVWGHSQGGHAAMFALHDADSYAPELHLEGVVAGAPPSQLGLVYDALKTSPYKYYLLMVAAAINAAYGDTAAPLSDVLNAQGLGLVNDVDNGCSGYLFQQTQNLDVDNVLALQADGTRNPASNPTWGPLIAAQDPANFTTPASEPLLIIHGGSDEQIPTVSSQILAAQLCSTGQDVERWMYPGQSHAGVIPVSFADMLKWMADRFAGVASPDAYVPTGQANIDATVCVNKKIVSMKPATPPAAPTPQAPTPRASTPATPVSATPTFTG